MRLDSLILGTSLVSGALATPFYGGKVQARQEDDDDLHVYDEACNIGYCSIFGATVGGWGGSATNVTTLEELTAAVAGSEESVVVVNGAISGTGKEVVAVGSSKSILGSPGSSLTGITLSLNASRNIILRNLKISSAEPVAIANGRSVWVDHCDLSSPPSHASSAPLLSIAHGSDYLTVSNNLFHSSAGDAARVGQGDADADEDRGKLHVTFIGNVFREVADTGVTFRFGTGHVVNSFFGNVTKAGVNAVMGADVLVESTIFEDAGSPPVVSAGSPETGFVTVVDKTVSVRAGNRTQSGPVSSAPRGNMTIDSLPYPYDWALWDFDTVRANLRKAGQTLRFRPAEDI